MTQPFRLDRNQWFRNRLILIGCVMLLVLPNLTATASPGKPEDLQGVFDQSSELMPVGQESIAGPLAITLLQVEEGAEAANRLLVDGSTNEPLVDGLQYVTVYLRVVNRSTTPVSLDAEDFAFLDDGGVVRRFTGVVPPAPSIGSSLPGGESREGWIAGIVQTESANLILKFDSLAITGAWADVLFALRPDSQVPGDAVTSIGPNSEGADPTSAAPVGVQVVTEQWAVTIIDVKYGQEVYDLYPASDYRTTALGSAAPELVPYWVAFLISVTNNRTGNQISFLPPTAFGLAWDDGLAVPDARILTSPSPDFSGGYSAGVTREGWVAIELPLDYEGSILRFLPFLTDPAPRYLTWGDGTARSPASGGVATPPPTAEIFSPDQIVSTIEPQVNLRATASTSGEIVQELELGAQLKVTGPAVEADGYLWYPVEVVDSGKTGFVASNFLQGA